MHAHFEQVEWGPVYLASGVTTVRDCGNELDFIRGVRDTIDAGRGLGPRILLACFVDGDGPASIGTSRIRTEKDIPDLIRRLQEARCSQVKIYSSLDPRLIAPLAKAAHAVGLTVTGHIPEGIGAVHAIEAGMDQINHVSYIVRALLPGEDPDARLPGAAYMRALAKLDTRSESARTIIALLVHRGIVVDPTLALFELESRTHAEMAALEPGLAKVSPALKPGLDTMSISPDREAEGALRWKSDLATLRALHEAGVPIVAGTDQAVPGYSLHREIEIYVSAGFTPMEAIQAATIVPARAMHKENDLGTVEPGKIADLVVVDGGKGQLSSAREALEAVNLARLPTISLAKRDEEIFIPGRSESLRLSKRSPALRMMQRMRDEAHRFAITYHRDLRSKRQTRSAFDDLPGVGPKRRRALLRVFGSAKRVRDAPVEQIAAVPGFGASLAARIKQTLEA
jgi:hypothetical protein